MSPRGVAKRIWNRKKPSSIECRPKKEDNNWLKLDLQQKNGARMRFVGVDPGKHGGVGIVDEDGGIISFDIMRDIQWFAEYVKEHHAAEGGCQILIEKAQVMAKQGASMQGAVGMFNYGVHFGELQGALAVLKIPYELVPPQTWTKVMHMGATTSLIPKEKSKVVLKRLFPGEDLRNPDAPKSKIMHDGIMDGILIAEFGRRRWKGQL